MSHDQDLLVRELQQRAEQMHDAPLGLADVKARARSIRRRRQAVTGAVAAVVLAVAAPVAITVTDAFDARPIPPAEQTETPNPDRTDNAQPQPFPDGPVLMTTQGLPEGEPPSLNYLVYGAEQELVTPQGALELPEQTGHAARYGEGWILTGGRGPLVRWVDADMNVVRSEPSASSVLAVSDNGGQVAWVQGRMGAAEVELLAAPTAGGDPRSWTLRPGDGEVRPVGFLGEDRVVFTVVETSLNAIAEPDGSVTDLEGFLSIRSASQAAGLVAVQTRYSMSRMCDGMVDPAASTSELLWETCGYKLGEFSPNGQYVVGTLAEADGMGSPSAVVFDARTGEVLVSYEPERNDQIALAQIMWEDDDSLLAITIDGVDGYLLRLGLDGQIEQTGQTGTSENMGLPFGFAEARP